MNVDIKLLHIETSHTRNPVEHKGLFFHKDVYSSYYAPSNSIQAQSVVTVIVVVVRINLHLAVILICRL